MRGKRKKREGDIRKIGRKKNDMWGGSDSEGNQPRQKEIKMGKDRYTN